MEKTDSNESIITKKDTDKKPILYSGMQATNVLTLGNYLGALKNWIVLNEEFECYFGVMDLHSLTVRQDPAAFRKNAKSLYALFIAAGLDPEKNCIYYQSHVPAHAYLGWILDCYTYTGELSRMTQFKDKSKKNADNINAGLFTYPTLMAADILLYQTDLVPVGKDQKQHLEIARVIADRFNKIYGDVFKIPEGYYGKKSAKIMSLQDPNKKMSKSDENINSTILLLDDKDTIIRKFKRAITDSETIVRFDEENKPSISNLMNIYGSITGKSYDEIEKEFDGKGYGDFKLAVGETVADELAPLQKRYNDILNDKEYLDKCIATNDQRAAYAAEKTLRKVRKKIGLTDMPRLS